MSGVRRRCMLRILRRVHNAPSDHIKDDRVTSKHAKCVRYLILVSLLVVTFTILLMSCGLRTAKRAMLKSLHSIERLDLSRMQCNDIQ
jgi:hypothetical protein